MICTVCHFCFFVFVSSHICADKYIWTSDNINKEHINNKKHLYKTFLTLSLYEVKYCLFYTASKTSENFSEIYLVGLIETQKYRHGGTFLYGGKKLMIWFKVISQNIPHFNS